MLRNTKKQRITKIILATLCLTLFASGVFIYTLKKRPHYTAKDLVWSGEVSEVPKSITSEQAKADINLLLYALDHAYGGKGFIRPSILARVEKQLRRIPKGKSMSTHMLWYKIHEVFLTIPDGHLIVCLPKNLVKSLPNNLKSKFIASRQALFQTRNVGNNKNTSQLPWFIQVLVG